MKTSQLLYLLLLYSFFSCTQEISCNDFKNGRFKEITNSDTKAYSIITRANNNQQSYRIDESGKRLNSKTFYATIEWINDCDYILKIDPTKTANTPDVAEINRNGGVLYKFLQFHKEYALYKVTLTLDRETITFTAEIHKE